MPRPFVPEPTEKRTLGLFPWEDPADANLTTDYIRIPGVVTHEGGRLEYRMWRGDRKKSPGPYAPGTQDSGERQSRGLWFWKSPTPRLLDGFLSLANASDE